MIPENAAGLPPPLRERLAAVRLLAMDVDGVLTDGTIIWTARPQGGAALESKSFSVKDGLGLSLAHIAGLPVVWITGRTSAVVERRAKELGVTVQSLGVREPDDFGDVFAAMQRDKPDGLLMVSDALTFLNRKRVFDFAAEHRLPAIYETSAFARDGGLMSYGPDENETAERGANLVLRILRGEKPADLPLEQPTRFRLVINLKTAKALGLTIPQSVLLRADDVIE